MNDCAATFILCLLLCVYFALLGGLYVCVGAGVLLFVV